MRALLAVSFAVLLAGCSGDEPSANPTDGDTAPSESMGSSTSAAAAVHAPPWTAEDVEVGFDGNLGTRVFACVFPAATCQGYDAVAGATDILVDRPGANFTGLDVTLAWTAQTPATANLGLGFMVMAPEHDGNHTFYPVVEGPSPLQATLSGANEPLTDGRVVHLYVYNLYGLVYDPNVPGYAFGSVDQAFRVEGKVSLLVPPAGGAAAAG